MEKTVSERERKNTVRPYWQDYVNHMFRVYFRALEDGTAIVLTPVEDENVRLVAVVLDRVGQEKREKIQRMFREKMEMERLAKDWGVGVKECWLLLSDVSKMVAKEKGLM